MLFLSSPSSCLTYAFIAQDFSWNTWRAIPIRCSRCSTGSRRCGAHEGSLLLWSADAGLWTFAVALFSAQPPAPSARASRRAGLGVSIGFLLFILFTSNPFERLLPAAPMAATSTRCCRIPGLIIHPPMLYMGYVGFSVAFAFAIAALLGGRLDRWARWSRPWTTSPGLFLTLGIALGSWWAYYELGWGGWWFWDPVENASFMPWLVGTALIHSQAVTEKRGAFRAGPCCSRSLTFSLSLLGTFLVRSGVLTSVHAFASDPARGVFILVPFVVVSDRRAAAVRAARPGHGPGRHVLRFSRETLLLRTTCCSTVAAAMVLLGTLYPLLLDALDARQDLGRSALLQRGVSCR
jgi:cytochrome c-type biogenesis protein CcmF